MENGIVDQGLTTFEDYGFYAVDIGGNGDSDGDYDVDGAEEVVDGGEEEVDDEEVAVDDDVEEVVDGV